MLELVLLLCDNASMIVSNCWGKKKMFFFCYLLRDYVEVAFVYFVFIEKVSIVFFN